MMNEIGYENFEEYQSKIKELYDKHQILTDGFKRVYYVGLWDRRLDMEKATPIAIYLTIPAKEKKCFKIEDRSWSGIIELLVRKLQQLYPKEAEEMYSYRTDWSNASVFTKTKVLMNMKKVEDYLYVNIGHTANHMLWLAQDIVKFYLPYNVTHSEEMFVMFLIHRPPFSEPKEVTDKLEPLIKLMFKGYLLYVKGLSNERSEKVIKGIDTLNYLLKKIRTSYDNFYLIDSTHMFSTFKSKLLLESNRYVDWNDVQLKTAKKYLDYLGSFFLMLEKNAKGKQLA